MKLREKVIDLLKFLSKNIERKRKKFTIYDLYGIFGDNAVYYVGGSEALPAPLTPKEEAMFVDMLSDASNREKAKSVLTEHNLRLVVFIAKRFENTKVGIEDLVSIGTVGLMKAIETFHPDRNIKLATYASRCIENEILMYIRKNSHNRNDISLEEPLNVDWDGNELLLSDILGSDPDEVNRSIEQEAEWALLRECVAKLSERERTIMQMRFGLGGRREHTQKEVADILGISQSYISRLEKKIIRRLKRDIEKSDT